MILPLRQFLAAAVPEATGTTDAQLLERFAAERDERAFRALLRRHGPMVWGVCSRLLPLAQDAEDCFQATFLVLVRKAGSIRPPEKVAAWLYGVASQTARKARAAAVRRRARERLLEAPPEAAAGGGVEPDLWPILQEELGRLPERYRLVVLLCDVQERTRSEAARELGLPEGTVAGWLARARALLTERLARRGVTAATAAGLAC
ncbi:MAG: RNA polymerase sigma factor, partial [Gemmataceae bacterium]|nr:RNA polymerase sigma factor [Gemmataceae bacterium]